VADTGPEEGAAGPAPPLDTLLQPGMTAVHVGADGSPARSMAEAVGPSGRVVVIDPGGGAAPETELPERIDLVLVGGQASDHLSLLGARRLLECPILLVTLWPQALREAGTDPVSLLDRYRAAGLRAVDPGRELPEDPGQLVQAVDGAEMPIATLRLERVDPPPRAGESLLPSGLRLGRSWARRFPPTAEPGTLAYDAGHRALVISLLESEEWRAEFAGAGRLPAGLGAGFDERVVEYPWLFSRRLSGRILDAGSVLNHRHLLERVPAPIEDLTIVTLAPEPVAFTELGASYLYGDLRRLPLRDDWFDEVVCLSTLEHVGMDNSVYGADGRRAENPTDEAARALRELLRVVRPGGRIHLSVPFGRREDHGWFRQLDRGDVDRLLTGAGVGRHEETVFRHTSRGWRRCGPRRAARARYHLAEGRAGAVLCATIQV
jgi:SAM-dependent methyltransferase